MRASVAHGLAGGTISEMQGGKFGHGFLSAGISKAATPMAVGVSDQVYIQGAAVAIVGGTTSEISGGKFANGAVTAAMAFAFNEVASRGQRGRAERAGRQSREGSSNEALSPTTCSEDSCIGYNWVSGETMVSGDRQPFWLGADMIGDHQWGSIIPSYLGRNLLVEGATMVVDLQVADEPGRWAYPHRQYKEVRQWQVNRSTGAFTSRRDYRYERQYQRRLIYKPIQSDQTIIYRHRFRSCIGGDCRVWSK